MVETDEFAIGPWTDVYLLGAILYRILSGAAPHQGATVSEVLLAAKEPVVPLSVRTRGRDVPEALARIVAKAMAFESAQRYPGAADLSKAIDEHFQAESSAEIASVALAALGAVEAKLARQPRPPAAEVYADLAGCAAQLEQACALWPGNALAADQLKRARLAWARHAIESDDPTVAEAQLEQLGPGVEGADDLRRQVAGLRAARVASRRRRGIFAAIALGLIVAVGGGAVALQLSRRAGVAEAALERRREALAIAAPASGASATARTTIYAQALAADPTWREGAAELSGAFMDLAYESRLGDPARGAAHLEEAARVLDPVLEANPDYAVGFYYRGYAREMLGQAAGALEDYRRAAKLDPDSHDGQAAAGLVAMVERRFADAERHASAAIAIAGDEDDHTRRALARFALGDLEGTMADLDLMTARSPTFAEYDAYAALVHLARGDVYSAAERLVEGARKQPRSPLVLAMLAYLAARRGDGAAAAELSARARTEQLALSRCYLCLETLHRPLEDAPEPRRALAKALLLSLDLKASAPAEPARSVALCARGEDLLAAGEPGNAIAFARRALADDPSDGRARLLRGTCFARLGQKEAARADLEVVGLIAPERADAARKVLETLK